MAQYDFDIGVLGGGSAGLTTAAGSSILGAKAAVMGFTGDGLLLC